jgi:hypothetical protein
MYREGLLEQELIYEQFDNVTPEPPPSQQVIDPGGAITGLTSNTLVVGGKVGTLQNVEAPQPVGPGATPKFNAVSPIDASGTNQPGTPLDLSGGKGTGTAEPGLVVVRYPLKTASGSGVHGLSTDRFPVSTGLFSVTSAGTAVVNTTTETSLFTGATPSAGSTRTIQGGSAATGSVYKIFLPAQLLSVGTPTLNVRVKLGSTSIAISGPIATPNNANGALYLEISITVIGVGAGGAVRAEMQGKMVAAIAGAVTPVFFVGDIGNIGIDFTANQTIDVTVEWGTANAGNLAQMIPDVFVERIR